MTTREAKQWQELADEAISDAGYWKAETRKLQHQCDELLVALNHSADKLNDLSEWLKAYAEPKQAVSVKAVEAEARAAIAAAEGRAE